MFLVTNTNVNIDFMRPEKPSPSKRRKKYWSDIN